MAEVARPSEMAPTINQAQAEAERPFGRYQYLYIILKFSFLTDLSTGAVLAC